MKILNVIREQENNEKLITDKINEVMIKLEELRNKTDFNFIDSPSGDYKCVVNVYPKRSSDTELGVTVKLYIKTKVPIIPLDSLSLATKYIIGLIKEDIPELFEISRMSGIAPGSITYNFYDILLAYGDTFLDLKSYIDRTYYNQHLVNLISIEELMDDQSIDFEYKLDPTQIPKFSDDFSLALNKVRKKMLSVYKGFRKGTYKGHEYEFQTNEPGLSVHINDNFYDRKTKVLHPKFRLSLNAGYPIIDNMITSSVQKYGNENKEVLTDKAFIEELENYVKSRFKQFNIDLL